MKRLILSVLSVFLLAAFTFAGALENMQVKMNTEAPNFAGWNKRDIVVKFDKSTLSKILSNRSHQLGVTGVPQLDALNQSAGVQKMIQKYPGLKSLVYQGRTIDPTLWFRISFNKDIDPEDLVLRYKALKGVIDAQPIGIHKVYASVNDPNFTDQWHLDQANDHDVDAPEAWDIETGNPNIIVALMDTGVRYFHKDLGGANASYDTPENSRGNMWINEAEKNGVAGVDDDGNGYVDDWIGWDFVTGKTGWPGEDLNTPDNDPRDFNGHGTHTSGIIGAINNNGYAVSSAAGGMLNGAQTEVGNGVNIMALRIGWSGQFFIFEVGYIDMGFAADAFYYAANNGARIASCSWGSSNSGGLGDAIDYFVASGGLVFKAAGNDDNENSDYMLDRADVIGVASTDQNDVKSDFSTYGTFVDISAPGTDIVSTYHDHDDPQNDKVATLSGTSMATPLSASVAALIWSRHPDWTSDQVKQRLFDTADDIYSVPGNEAYAGKLGAGRVNAFNAVNDGGSGPVPPTANFSASPTSGCPTLAVNFTDQSTGDITDWSWDFGDGSTSTLQNPIHDYTAPGSYTVSLTVTGPGGSDTNTKTNYITVTDGNMTADFSGTPTSGDAPLTVAFTDQSSGDISTWNWDFGDGGSSTAQSPSYTYNTAGTYTVSLSISNACGSDVMTKTDYITVTQPTCNAPVADFSATPLSGDAPLLVDFTDNSTNSPTSWSWDFGDGGSSTAQNPSYTYNNAGTYTVSMTATNDCGSDTQTKVDYITVTQPPVNDAMHVGQLDVVKEGFFVFTRGHATVKIVDQNGNGLANATVDGSWHQSGSGSVTLTTDANGLAESFSNWIFGSGDFQFCVDNVTLTGYSYNASANVATCASTDGSSSAVFVKVNNIKLEDIEGEVGFKVATNAPNPFNPSTTITYLIPEQANVRVEIFNTLGQKIKTLVDGTVNAGVNSVIWHGKDLTGRQVSSGFYIYQITINNKDVLRKKILMLK